MTEFPILWACSTLWEHTEHTFLLLHMTTLHRGAISLPCLLLIFTELNIPSSFYGSMYRSLTILTCLLLIESIFSSLLKMKNQIPYILYILPKSNLIGNKA